MDNLVDLVKNAGIIGAGGAGFPTYVKLNSHPEYLIMNGAECEPLLRVDQQLMKVYVKEIVEAFCYVLISVGAKKGFLALKKKYHDAIGALENEIKKYENIELSYLDDFYPAGDEQVTVYEVLKKIVPEGGIPLNVGAVVLNVETLLNISKALKDENVTETYLTITGDVKNPVTVKVPVGISFYDALNLAGGTSLKEYSVIDGGPMMGKIANPDITYVKKSTKGYIILPNDHPIIIAKNKNMKVMLKEAKTACCHCSMCTEVCPRNLLGHNLHPDKLMRLASYNSTCENDASSTEAFLCCECGLCEVACIMGLQPWKLNTYLKTTLSQNGIKNPNNKQPVNVSSFREYKKYPVKKLISRLELTKYNKDAPLTDVDENIFKEVKILLRQHIGIASEVVVSVNDMVSKGQLIARIPEGKMGSNIHASIDGIVSDININSIIIKKNGGGC